jgi:hypothetical protein
VIEATKGQKSAFGVEARMKMQTNAGYTIHGRGSNRRAASGSELTFSGSELLLSVGVFLALISLSIWVLVHYCVFAK